MRTKLIVLISVFMISSVLLFQNSAYAIQTKWAKVESSMEQLLNSGWQIVGHSSNRVAVGSAGAANNYDEIIYTYLLTKKGSYISCGLLGPRPPSADAGCRSLN
jgi:hypothetical protein